MAPLSDFLFRIEYAIGNDWTTIADDLTYGKAQDVRRHMAQADDPIELRITASRTLREAMVPSFADEPEPAGLGSSLDDGFDHETWDELAAPYIEDAEREARFAPEQHSIRVDPDHTDREEA